MRILRTYETAQISPGSLLPFFLFPSQFYTLNYSPVASCISVKLLNFLFCLLLFLLAIVVSAQPGLRIQVARNLCFTKLLSEIVFLNIKMNCCYYVYLTGLIWPDEDRNKVTRKQKQLAYNVPDTTESGIIFHRTDMPQGINSITM